MSALTIVLNVKDVLRVRMQKHNAYVGSKKRLSSPKSDVREQGLIMPRNPDTEQNSKMAHLAMMIALLSLLMHRNTPHKIRCRRKGESCSRYGTRMIGEHGFMKGLGMSMIYISECKRGAI